MTIDPTAHVAPSAQLGENVEIGPGASVGPKAIIGDNCRVDKGAIVTGCTTLGPGNILYPYAVLGTPPQDLKHHGEDTRLEIGDDNVFREFVSVNTGTITGSGKTQIGSRNYLMIGSHVGHDCILEDDTILVNAVLLGGHCRVESGAQLTGAVAVNPFVTIGSLAYVGGLSRIVQDVPPYMIVEGNPAKVRAVNEIGLERAGYSRESIARLWGIYKRIYRAKKLNRTKIFDQIEALDDPGEEVLYLVRFLRRSLQGQHGRFRESLRKA